MYIFNLFNFSFYKNLFNQDIIKKKWTNTRLYRQQLIFNKMILKIWKKFLKKRKVRRIFQLLAIIKFRLVIQITLTKLQITSSFYRMII